MNRAYKYRIYPTKEQETVLRQTVGSCRFVYNWMLDKINTAWENGEKVKYTDVSGELPELKKELEWLKEPSSVCLQQSLRNCDQAFQRFFRKQSRYPKFKSRKNGGGIRFTQNAFRLRDGFYVAKIKDPIKIVWSRDLPSEPTSCTISLTPSGKWFVSFVCESEESLPESQNSVGVDLGIKTFATLSDGRKFNLPDVKNLRKKVAWKQRKLSRKQKGSRNRNRARKSLARTYERITNIQEDFLHKLSTQLIRENQTIALEDLAVQNMVKNRKLSRAISEQGWRKFRTMLEYKSKLYGRDVVTIDRYEPTTKICSCCGTKVNIGLDVRSWDCACGATHDRDVNAAKNILAAGQAVLACGVDIRPKDAMLTGSRL